VKGTFRLVLCVVCLLVPALAAASNEAPDVAITSPTEGVTLAAGTVAVEASFASRTDALVEHLEFTVDGVTVDARALDPAQEAGRVSFSWVARRYAEGEHAISITAVDSTGGVGQAAITVLLRNDLRAPGRGVRLTAPAEGETVRGKTTIQVEVEQPRPATYVIFLVDDVFKAMSNVRPFAYAWDTTRYLNGLHRLQAKAYVAGPWELISPVVEVSVDNPSGATSMRTPQVTMKPVAPSPLEPPARAGSPVLPPPMRSESPSPPAPAVALPSPDIAAPGTAPFVSASGELISPALPRDPALRSRSVTIAALPTSAPAPRAELSTPAPRSLGGATPLTPPLEPTVAPLEVTLLDVPDVPVSVALEPSASVASEADIAQAQTPVALESEAREPTAAPLEMAMLAVPEKPALPPAQRTPAAVEVQVAATATPVNVRPVSPGPTEIEIAMLPPRPVEQRPASRVAAEPALEGIVYIVRGCERLGRVAAEVGVPAAEIARANNLRLSTLLRAGQTLVIPSTPVYFNDRPLRTDAPSVIADGRAIVPFRSVVEEAGGTVRWDVEAKRASAVAAGHELAVTIGSDRASIDGSEVTMSQAAALRCDRTMVPLRFLGDALDLVLQYEDGVIHIAGGF
jgi:hypothetical protein